MKLMKYKTSNHKIITELEEQQNATQQWALETFQKDLKAFIEAWEAEDYQVNIHYKNTADTTSG